MNAENSSLCPSGPLYIFVAMFLDPDPRSAKKSAASPLAFAGMPTTVRPEDQNWWTKRKPLQERGDLRRNEQRRKLRTPSPAFDSQTLPEPPTVRLVKHSPSSSMDPRSSMSDWGADEVHLAKQLTVQKYDGASARLSQAAVAQEASVAEPGLFASSQDLNVSASQPAANEDPKTSLPRIVTLLPQHSTARSRWHRRSVSSGNNTNSSTLFEGDTSSTLVAPSRKSQRLSDGTTLRGTPTPYEQEHLDRSEDDDSPQKGPAHALQTLQEASPERPTTVRAVPPSVSSDGIRDRLGSLPSERSPTSRPLTASSESDAESLPNIQRFDSRRPVGSPLSSHLAITSSPPAQQSQASEQPLRSDSIFPDPSSPIIVIFDHESSSRPRSRSHPLHHASSIESIQSRLQQATVIRPGTEHSLAHSSSWASLRPTSSYDTLPPLSVPKKRLRQQRGSLSASAAGSSSGMEMDEYDALPYPRQQFSGHLSTIASESDRQSRTNSRLSHFSLGSGVLTGDDASSIPLSGARRSQRRPSAPLDPDSSSRMPNITPEEEAGDMTLGIFREESAKPQPLFKERSPSAPGDHRHKYQGTLPPVPPVPKSRDSNEDFDIVTELQSPALRSKRSGYSLRQRSSSTPSRSHSHSRVVSQVSYVDSERDSHGSSIFPTWAKHFYGGTAHLISASKISLSRDSSVVRHPQTRQTGRHERNGSQWTEQSVTSRLGTGYSEISAESPTSSRFLPSIFRPRTRARANTGGTMERWSKIRKSKRSRPSGDDSSRPDSLAIFQDPLPAGASPGGREVLPSGQPKYGDLKDSSYASPHPAAPGHRPLPRKYSKQKLWDEMQYPRPMTKDRLSDFALETDPHLRPTKRQQASGRPYSSWRRPPSFVESLDTIIRSRCNRQVLLFALGFLCPILWMVAAVLPLPERPGHGRGKAAEIDLEKTLTPQGSSANGSVEDVAAAMMKHSAGDAERAWREEKRWAKARWWRGLNRVMCLVGIGVIAAVVSSSYPALQDLPMVAC